MKKKKGWEKELFDRRSRRLQKKKRKKRIGRGPQRQEVRGVDRYRSLYQDVITDRYDAPGNFSLTCNTDETVDYFNKIIDGIKEKLPGKNFVINSSKVNSVTVDALIYLIAIMENMKLNKTMRYVFTGTFPDDRESELVYKESGFMDYVTARDKRLFLSKTKVRIRSGKNNLPMVAKEICDFVISEYGVERRDILFINKILVELMSNSFYHAYPDDINNEMYSKWYLYAERIGDTTRIIFADTGKGITGTVRRKPNEKIREFVGKLMDDELLYYAFQPDNFIRTETNETHRGNGLPGIKEVVEKSPINSFWVFSGRGGIHIQGDMGAKALTKHRFLHKIYGTIVVFEFNKGGMCR